MSLRKTQFYTIVRDGGKMIAQKQNGWTDNNFNYYENKSDNQWYAIEPLTGLSICSSYSRKAVVELANSEKIQKKLEDAKNNNSGRYQDAIVQFYNKKVEYGAIMENLIK